MDSTVPKIKFSKIENHAERDKAVFRSYLNGYITAEKAAEKIAETNDTEVTTEMFLQACVDLGWVA